MKAALMRSYRSPLEIIELADPEPPPDGVVVRVKACGVCRSDWHGWRGTDPDIVLPHVPGHELAGVVEAVGPDCRDVRIGDRVTVPVILGCGRCPTCRGGELTVCDRQYVVGFTGWGAFAERVAVPYADANVVRLPEEMSFEVAAALGCRTTTAFRGVVDRARLRPGEIIAVHGCGGVGLSAVMIAQAIGATVIAVDIVPEKLELARTLGATHTIDASAMEDVGRAIRELTGGGAQVSIDALGITATFHNSIRGLAKLGRHVQVGQPLDEHATPSIPLLETVYSRQISVIGSRGLPAIRFPAVFEMIRSGRLDPARLIRQRIALEEATGVFELMDSYADVGVTVIDRF
ncbi:MAG: zinc-dependent alcohol dehydrogenase family protein [Gemmatimonadales bacterium]